MSNECTIRTSLQVRTGKINYSSQPVSFVADMTGAKGPTPGAITVALIGTDVDFSELTQPGYCRMQNLDATNFVQWGVRDPVTMVFYPIGEILPGETYVIRFSRYLRQDYYTSGTGTTGDLNHFHLKADTAACVVLVEAFDN